MNRTPPSPEELERARPEILQALTRGMAVAAWAKVLPGHPAVLGPRGERTFRQLNGNANRLVRCLRARGVRAGDAVALMCQNRPEFCEVVHACRRAGLRLTPVNWHLGGAEAGYIVDNCDAKAFIADASCGEAAQAAADRAPWATVRLSVAGSIPGFDDYASTLDLESGADIEDPTLGGNMLYTSGTTGLPKGVAREAPASGQLAAMAAHPLMLASNYRPGESVHLVTGPLYHSAPLSFSLGIPHMSGAAVLLMERWDSEQALRLIQQHRATHSHMVPTMFHRLLSLPEQVRRSHDVSSLQFILHGAAPCPVHVKRALIDWLGPIVHEYYAATEGMGTIVDSRTWLQKPGTVGRAATAGHIKVFDEHGEELSPGVVGRVYMRATDGTRFRYHKDDQKTASAFRGDYFTLGDMGYLDHDGYLFLTDRSTELIISGGVNIYPAEVEAVLLRSPHVGDVAVIGVPSEEWGEEVKAVVEVADGSHASAQLAEELVALCRRELAGFKCPRSVDFVDSLPRSDAGKLHKDKVRARYR